MDGKVGYFAATEEVQYLAWVCGGTAASGGIDGSHGDDPVEHGGQGVDDVAGVAFHRHMGGVDIGVCGFDLEQSGSGLVNRDVVVAGVFDVEEDEPLVEHTGKEAGMADHGLGHGEVGKVGNDKLVFHLSDECDVAFEEVLLSGLALDVAGVGKKTSPAEYQDFTPRQQFCMSI